MRTVNVKDITRNVKEMCIEANYCLTDDMDQALKQVVDSESSPLGKQVLCQLQEKIRFPSARILEWQ